MPRYGDAWVVDRTLYNHISNGVGASCLCCGGIGGEKNNKKSKGPFPFDPEGWRGMLNVLIDWTAEEVGIDFQDNVSNDNDTTKTKISSSSYSKKWKWPTCDIRDEIWFDRIRLRRNMMKDVEMYRTFTMEVFMKIISNSTGIGIPSLQDKQRHNQLPQYQQQQLQLQSKATLKKYCLETIGIESLQKDIFYPIRRNDVFNNIIIVPRERKQTQTDDTLIKSNKGVIKSKALYNIILDSCLTQVAMFHLTRYGLDGRREVKVFDNDNIGNDRYKKKVEGEEEEWWGEIGFEHLLSYKGDTYGGLGSSGGGDGSDGWFVLDVANNCGDDCDNDHHDIDDDSSSSDEDSCKAFGKYVNIAQQSSQQQEQEQEWELSNDGKNLDTFLSILVCGWLNSNANYYNDDDPIQLFPKASSNCKGKGGFIQQQQQQQQQKQNERLIVAPNFRGDRRVVRLLLARIWAGRFIERWRNDHA